MKKKKILFTFFFLNWQQIMRQLKHHEQKLLKKVDFLQWKKDDTIREQKVIRRYYLQQREDYHK